MKIIKWIVWFFVEYPAELRVNLQLRNELEYNRLVIEHNRLIVEMNKMEAQK